MDNGLYRLAHQALLCPTPEAKAARTRALLQQWQHATLGKDHDLAVEAVPRPGYPPALHFVAPHRVARRGAGSLRGRIHLFHAIAHIEYTAINLALDAVYRFRDLPDDYVTDWLTVAAEEVHHFELIRAHLHHMGADYGELPVHDGLWEVARDTAHDALHRMALVPRYLEARGLDVNPGMQEKLREAGDSEGVAILEVILRDEIGHVARGDHWFRHLCQRRGLPPEASYRRLVEHHAKHPWHGPFHCAARQAAGFSRAELQALGCDEQGPRKK